jgi:hypothetical protein
MAADLSDFKLEAYKNLRAEITHYLQAMSALLGVALTAIGAIGAFALTKPGNREALLILPFVLSGLGLVQVSNGVQIRRRDEYIRTYVWPTNSTGAAPPYDPDMSWEEWIARIRLGQSAVNLAKVSDAVGYIVIFAFPSAGALALTASAAFRMTPLGIVWVAAVLVMAATAAVGIVVEGRELAPSDKHPHDKPREWNKQPDDPARQPHARSRETPSKPKSSGPKRSNS